MLWTDDGRLPKLVMYREATITNRRPGRSRNNWIDTIRQDLKEIGLYWDKSAVLKEKPGIDVWFLRQAEPTTTDMT